MNKQGSWSAWNHRGISKFINSEEIYSEPKCMRVIKWWLVNLADYTLVKRYEEEHFGNVFKVTKCKHGDNIKFLLFPLHIKSKPKVYNCNNRNNEII